MLKHLVLYRKVGCPITLQSLGFDQVELTRDAKLCDAHAKHLLFTEDCVELDYTTFGLLGIYLSSKKLIDNHFVTRVFAT